MTFEEQVLNRLRGFVLRNRDLIKDWCEEMGYDCYDELEALDREGFEENLKRMGEKGWTVEDAYRYHIYSEEMDPRWTEGDAIRMMARISRKYK